MPFRLDTAVSGLFVPADIVDGGLRRAIVLGQSRALAQVRRHRNDVLGMWPVVSDVVTAANGLVVSFVLFGSMLLALDTLLPLFAGFGSAFGHDFASSRCCATTVPAAGG
jgi:hypothetical protein